MKIEPHECFTPPASNVTIWRYTDLTKLLSILESRAIYFPRSDKFDDPYEGAFSKASIEQLRSWATSKHLDPSQLDGFVAANARTRLRTFINCWFAKEHESAAMWKLYLQSPEGVAIRSDYDALCRAITNSPYSARVSLVSYVDYEKVTIPLGNAFYPFVHKRLSFEHESELRAIIWGDEDVNAPLIPQEAMGVSMAIDPADLIKAIHVSPTAPTWFGDLVEQLLKRYGMHCSVERSGLYNRPAY